MPRAPGSIDGVGDYSLTVARRLLELYGYDTLFAPHLSASTATTNGFEILSPLSSDHHQDLFSRKFRHVILHYVNYGYQKRGVPFGLMSTLRTLRRNCPGRFLTIFHELYASGPPWKSEFWLRPLQIQIARSVARLSDACIVSSETALSQLQRLRPNVPASLHPVISNLGEPLLPADHFANRSPHSWVICGGTTLVERSARSFCATAKRIPQCFRPRELFVLGGTDNPKVRSLLTSLIDIQVEYYPQVAASDASRILSTSSWAWLDYFHHVSVPTALILKSGAFAAACAHGVISIFPHPGSEIALGDDRLPGPYFIHRNALELPAANDRARIASDYYRWYRRCASSEHLTRGVACLLGDLGADADERGTSRAFR